MKNIKSIIFSLMLVFLATSCVEDDYELAEIRVPSNLNVNFEVVGQTTEMPDGDGSGVVNFMASADNAMTYKFIYGDGFEDISFDGKSKHPFTKNGVNDYNVTVVASGAGGALSSMTTIVTVFSDFSDPVTKELLTGGNSKTWYVAASVAGHLGVGPSTGDGFEGPIYYAAAPFEKSGTPCFYNDELTFSLQGEDIVYNYDNKGQTFFNASYNAEFGGGGSDDQCLDFDASGIKSVSLSPSTSGLPEDITTGTVLNISGGGFMSYYAGGSSYELLKPLTANSMYVRVIMGNNPALAWYLKFTTSQGEEETEEFVSEFDELSWEANFDTESVLDPSVWNFETGNNDGWGNVEAQYYTENNAVIEGGNLVITAKAEATNGFDYSSSRITTKDNFEFKYGRIEARAKLPEGGGTWPAIWMLGATFPEESWPGVGEIDIMEHAGNRQNTIQGTLHYPGSDGDENGGSKIISNASSEFHIYTVEWSEERIWFLVDDEVYHMYENTPDSPFNKDFFLIMNVAMGGNFGGNIDPAFSQSSMEVDYIKVYK